MEPNMANKIGKIVHCDFCSKEIYKAPWELKKRKHVFCNMECKSNWMKGKSTWNTNKPHTEDHKQHLKDAWVRRKDSGYVVSDDTRDKISKGHKGKILTVEHKQKISDRLQGHIVTEETRDKQSSAKIGKYVGSKSPKWNSILVKCDYCSKEIYRQPSTLKKRQHIFCNMKCKGLWMKDNLIGKNSPSWKGVEVVCSYCNKELTRYPSNLEQYKNVFCNRTCKRLWQKEHSQKPKTSCAFCNKEIYRLENDLKRVKHVFCNNTCKNKWKIGRQHMTPDQIAKMAQKLKGRKAWNKNVPWGPETVAKLKARWKDPIFVMKYMKSLHMKPNKPELALQNLLNDMLPNEYHYTGDGKIIIDGRCPDFMNMNGQKKLIELYGTYWHKGQDPQDRIDLFKKFSFDTLIIWEDELKDKEKLKTRILEFNNKPHEQEVLV